MRPRVATLSRFVSVFVSLLLITPLLRGADLSAEDLLAKHLDSIGAPEVRNAKTRVAQGTVLYKILVGGSGQAGGRAVFVSDGPKRQIMMKIDDRNYRGEQWIFNGEKCQVSFSLTSQQRSQIGEFLYYQDAPQREGLLGGLLTASWPLFDLASHDAKLTYKGLKKMDGRDLHDVVYQSKKNGDYDIHLYFDPETFRHVMTVYNIYVQPKVRFNGDTRNARQTPERHRIEERFSEFKQFDGLTLPTHYDLQYTQELQTGGTTLFEYDITITQISNSEGVDSRNFDVK